MDEAARGVSADSGALVYTMRDLSQDPSRIIGAITEARKPAFITSHSRFVAVITALDQGEVESRVLAEMARELSRRENGTAA